MEKAYIILAHKNAAQVMRLINALDDNQSTFFLHVDKKAETRQFKSLCIARPNVVAVKSVNTGWASFGLVEATLRALSAVAKHPKQFNFITLLSGQHYPIKSNHYINQFLSNTRYRIFLEYTSIPNHQRWKPRGGLYRIDKYFLGMKDYQRYTAKALNFLSAHLPFLRRTFPQAMKPYAGSQWFTIDNYTLHYILHTVRCNKAYSAYHRYTFAPDELFFHNLLLNADNQTIRTSITNNNLLYMNWLDTDKAHPDVLTVLNFSQLQDSDALFARKFDLKTDAAILDLIDDNRNMANKAVRL